MPDDKAQRLSDAIAYAGALIESHAEALRIMEAADRDDPLSLLTANLAAYRVLSLVPRPPRSQPVAFHAAGVHKDPDRVFVFTDPDSFSLEAIGRKMAADEQEGTE